MFAEGSSAGPRTMEKSESVLTFRKLMLLEWGALRLEPDCRATEASIAVNYKSEKVYYIQDIRLRSIVISGRAAKVADDGCTEAGQEGVKAFLSAFSGTYFCFWCTSPSLQAPCCGTWHRSTHIPSSSNMQSVMSRKLQRGHWPDETQYCKLCWGRTIILVPALPRVGSVHRTNPNPRSAPVESSRSPR